MHTKIKLILWQCVLIDDIMFCFKKSNKTQFLQQFRLINTNLYGSNINHATMVAGKKWFVTSKHKCLRLVIKVLMFPGHMTTSDRYRLDGGISTRVWYQTNLCFRHNCRLRFSPVGAYSWKYMFKTVVYVNTVCINLILPLGYLWTRCCRKQQYNGVLISVLLWDKIILYAYVFAG